MMLATHVLIGYFLGAAVAVVAAMAVYATTDPSYVPPWIDILARWGTWRPRRPRLRSVDVSLETRPADYDPSCYPCEMGDPHRTHQSASDFFGLEPDPNDPNVEVVEGDGYAGRHRRDVLEQDYSWRNRWAAFDTAGWPLPWVSGDNLTSGQILDLRPDICCGRPAVPEKTELPLLAWLGRPAPTSPPVLALADL